MSNHGPSQRASRLGNALAIVFAVMVVAAVPGAARAGDAEDIRNAITKALQKSDPDNKYKGITWTDWRSDTRFDPGWLLQTPAAPIWGQPASLPWLVTGEVDHCPDPGPDCDRALMLPTCTPGAPGACSAWGTQCVASSAAQTKVGLPPTPLCMSYADLMVEETFKTITQAQSYVDITSLTEPTGRFMDGLRNAITYLANTGRAVTIRYLMATIPGKDLGVEITHATLNNLVAEANHIPGGHKLKVYVGRLRSGSLSVTGWNHAKTIIVDGKTLIAGGENWVHDAYLAKSPVFDLNMRVSGQVANDASHFVDFLWKDLCGNLGHIGAGLRRAVTSYQYTNGSVPIHVGEVCPGPSNVAVTPGGGKRITMGVGHVGEIDYDHGRQGWVALTAMIRAARDRVRISQQNIEGISNRWPDEILSAIAEQIVKKREVRIVQSGDGAKGSSGSGSTSGYSNGTLTELADKLKEFVKRAPDAPRSDKDLVKLLCKYLHLAQIRFTPGVAKYGNHDPIPNHAKFLSIDDSAFYIGSQNLYTPIRNMEYGVIVVDDDPFTHMMESYWNPLWDASKTGAISGDGAASCYYE